MRYIKDNKKFISTIILTLLFIIILNVFKVKSISFLLLSLLVNIIFIKGILEVLKILNIKFSKKEKLIIILVICFNYLFYLFSLINRNFIYYWDYSCYYNIQMESIERFNEGLSSGIRYFIGSTWSGEYGNFLSFIPQVIFQFSNKNVDSYIMSCVLVFTPYIVISLSILLKELIKKYSIKNNLIYVVLPLFILFPLLHGTAIYGQPDYFGLFFIFLIIALTLSYDFKKLDYLRLFIILVLTYLLLISRRWYMYWILSYYVCYVIGLIIKNIKSKEDIITIIKNGIIYALVCGLFFGVTLFPLFKNILASNMQSNYSFYMSGGLQAEFFYQYRHLGLITLLIVLVGIILGIKNNKYRLITILGVIQSLIIIILFTKIQNMGIHHTLTLLPTYLLFITLFIININNKLINKIIISFFILNFIISINGSTNKLFTDIKISVPYQEDYKEIGEVVTYLKDILDEDNTAYMITHTNKYNPDKLRSYELPDTTIQKYLPYGSAVLGAHKFPLELFTARYVITTTPFESISIEEKYNEVFNELVKEEVFTLNKDFDMHNGYHILIYERVKPVTIEETDKYIEKISADTKNFKDIYENLIKEYQKSL